MSIETRKTRFGITKVVVINYIADTESIGEKEIQKKKRINKKKSDAKRKKKRSKREQIYL